MKRWVRPLLLLALLGTLTFVYHSYDLAAYFDTKAIRELIQSSGPYGPLIFIGLCIGGVFLHMPEIVIVALGGVLFGTLQGFLYGWIGAMLGATGTFLLVRYAAQDAVQRSLGERFEKLRSLDKRLEQHGFQTVLLLRLILFMAPPLNWLIALTRVRLTHYLAGSALGVIPGIALTCYFADSIAQAESLSALLTPELILLAALLLVLVVGGGVFSWRLLGKKPSPQPERAAPPGL